MPSSVLYTVTRPPKPKKDWDYAPIVHLCEALDCARWGSFGTTFPATPQAAWWCYEHAPREHFTMLAPVRSRAAFRLDDEVAA